MVILLDIDGVLLPANSWSMPEFLADGFPKFNDRAASALQKIINKTGASIILTTSHKASFELKQWAKIFDARGIRPVRIDRLYTDSLSTDRMTEIKEWHSNRHQPVEPFVIIDDDKRLNGLPEAIKTHLILTSSSVGLTDELADQAIHILQNQP